MIYFVITFSILFAILAWKRLDWAVLILIAGLPAYLIRAKIFIPTTLLEVMILISFAAWLFKNYQEIFNNIKLRFKNKNCKLKIENCKLTRYPFDIEIILLLIISFAAAGIVGFTDSALGIWKAYFFEPALFFIVVFNIFKGKEGVEKIILSLAVSAFAVSLFAIYQKFTGQFIANEFWAAETTRRATSFFDYPNAVGLYLGPLAVLFYFYLISLLRKKDESKFKALFLMAVIIFSFAAVYSAKSDGALIASVVSIFVGSLFISRRAAAITVFMAIIFAVVIFSQPILRSAVLKKITLQDLSGQIRIQQWKETRRMLTDGRLIFGSGLANYQKEISPYHQEGIFYNKFNDPDFHRKTVISAEYRASVWQPVEVYLYPHNILLNFWTELGLAGMILFIFIFIKFYYLGVRLFRISNGGQGSKFIIIGLLGAMTVIIIHGLVDVPYFKNDLAVLFWLLVAMLGIININQLKEKY